ncbi:intein-containing Rv2578c family radical SAM protein [Microbacterium capsulatum]|uniref:Intein-containing Rv2578c family radical SAM protein n=1 Tax=Microbacterium capsulatum TaxID=3041921 RepID=A0ABU0XJK3_9MICO|nr:intein-containing Rv2578c family radical SAM protein [Microbacterium sp. ASV81]MDQ4215286.1 intein-containing Rv2578c family radical SAM protein [Microbacterium sp. ASV81]
MRWQGQRIDEADEAALPGMENRTGFLRTVTTPEFAGMTFHEVLAKSALNHVPGPSKMPFAWTINPYRGCSHACVYCVSPETLILCADGRQRPLRDLEVGTEIYGTEKRGAYRRYVRTRILAKWSTRKQAYRITLADGTVLTASGDHRFLTDRGWKHVTGGETGQRPHLTLKDRLLGFGGGAPPKVATDGLGFRHGYLFGMIRGDGMIFRRTDDDGIRKRKMAVFRLALADEEALERTRSYLRKDGIDVRERPFSTASPTRRALNALHTAAASSVAAIEAIVRDANPADPEWCAGFLSGIFDAEGSCSRGVLRISNKDPEILDLTSAAMSAWQLEHVVEPPRPNDVRDVRLVGGLPARQRFFSLTKPAITRKMDLEGLAVKTVADLRVRSIEPLDGEQDLLDITTGTGDFVANGVISHNCFARGTHTYLDLDAGHDFDSQIVVKVNVVETLEKELRRGSWQHETVALGTNTDPYQRAEGRYRLMPGIIRALADSGTPFSVLTKGTLIRRDIPLLVEAAARVPVDVQLSIAMFDETLREAIEQGAPSTQARLDTVRALSDAGFRVGVFLMPILPHLTDSVDAIDRALLRIKESGADHVIYGALHLRAGVKPWFLQWLSQHRPDLLSSYRALYPGTAAEAPKDYRRWLARRVRPLIRMHGLEARHSDDRPARRSMQGPDPEPTGAMPLWLFEQPSAERSAPSRIGAPRAPEPAPTLF